MNKLLVVAVLLFVYIAVFCGGNDTPAPVVQHVENTTINVVYVNHDPRALIKRVFGDEWSVAIAVAMAESHMRPDAIGDKKLSYVAEDGVVRGYSVGLFQIQLWSDRPPAAMLLDVYTNVMVAHYIRHKPGMGGWSQWGSFTNGSYKKFLPVYKAQSKKRSI